MINKSHSSINDMAALRGSSILDNKDITFWGLFTQAFSFVVGISALPLRLFLRKNLGERSIRPGTFMLSIALHIYYFTIFDALLILVSIISLDLGEVTTEQMIRLAVFILINPYFIFLILVIRKAIIHFRRKIREAKSGQVSHSYYRGESRYFSNRKGGKIWGFTIDETTTRMLVEPKSIFKYGLVLFFCCLAILLYMILITESNSEYLTAFLASLGCTGLVISFDAICLFLEEFTLFMSKRDKVLDMLDSQDDMSEIVKEKAKIENERKNINPSNPNNNLSGLEDEDVKLD